MLGFDGYDPWHVAGYFAAWLGLFALAVVLAVAGRRVAGRHALPLDAPADLDSYGLAVLAGGAERLRDAALAALAWRGELSASPTVPTTYREPAGPPARPPRLPPAVGPRATGPTHVVE